MYMYNVYTPYVKPEHITPAQTITRTGYSPKQTPARNTNNQTRYAYQTYTLETQHQLKTQNLNTYIKTAPLDIPIR